MAHIIWKLQIFNQQGEAEATASQEPNGPPVFNGLMNALAEVLPAVINLNRFLTGPDATARAIYETFRADCADVYGLSAAEWDTLAESDPALADKWRVIAKAATADPSLN